MRILLVGAAVVLIPALSAHAATRELLKTQIRAPNARIAMVPAEFFQKQFDISQMNLTVPMERAVQQPLLQPVVPAGTTENKRDQPGLLSSIITNFTDFFGPGRKPASEEEIDALAKRVWDAGGKRIKKEFSATPIKNSPLFGTELPSTSLQTALDKDYSYLRDLSIAIQRSYPPSEYYYVGIGRSPTPVMAMIQSILGDSAGRNIPLSNMRLMRTGITDTEADPALFKKHMEHSLPISAREIGGKKILVIDWADTGATMAHLKRDLSRLMEERSPENRILFEYLALTHGTSHMIQQLQSQGIRPLVVTGRLLSIFDERRYREFTEYDTFSIARYHGNAPSQKYEPPAPVTLAIKQQRHREYAASITYAGSDSERWVRQAKRKLEREFSSLASYDSLKDGYRSLVARDRWVKGLLGLTTRL